MKQTMEYNIGIIYFLWSNFQLKCVLSPKLWSTKWAFGSQNYVLTLNIYLMLSPPKIIISVYLMPHGLAEHTKSNPVNNIVFDMCLRMDK